MHLECIWSELGILVLGLGAPGMYLESTWMNLECTWSVLGSGVLGVYLGAPGVCLD